MAFVPLPPGIDGYEFELIKSKKKFALILQSCSNRLSNSVSGALCVDAACISDRAADLPSGYQRGKKGSNRHFIEE